jgi:ATP-binding cassette subfamily B protein RaxB
MIAAAYGAKIDIRTLRQIAPQSQRGADLPALMSAASKMGLACRPLKVAITALHRLRRPAILHWNMSHFVVLVSVDNNGAVIHDPVQGKRRVSSSELSDSFSGVAIEIAPVGTISIPAPDKRTSFGHLLHGTQGVARGATEVALLAAFLQLTALVAPLFLQLAVDSAAATQDRDFLLTLALGFGGVVVVGTVTEALRSWASLHLGTLLTEHIGRGVVQRLLKLPVSYFERRHLADIASRIASTRNIQNGLVSTIPSAVIDGLTAISVGIVVFFYSLSLGAIIVGGATLFFAASWYAFERFRRIENLEITARAIEQSTLLQAIRSIHTLKASGRESALQAVWSNTFVGALNASFVNAAHWIAFDLIKSTILGLQMILAVYVAIRLAMTSGTFSLGMVFAVLSYRQTFTDRVTSFTRHILEVRLLGVHLDRVNDIIRSEIEAHDGAPPGNPSANGPIEISNLGFRYSPNDPWIFRSLNLQIKPGTLLAITGRTGAGKTTLLKLLLGFYQPTEGQLLIDRMPLPQYGLARWRDSVGVVMQDDSLLSGSIADNIAFFDVGASQEDIEEAARLAHVHDDILKMPMGYRSQIGDMGSALSGGQRQRLLLARALYRKPRVLLLDEGTANLDEDTERAIADVIAAMPITRIIIAHRPEFARRADRVICIEDGALRETTISS